MQTLSINLGASLRCRSAPARVVRGVPAIHQRSLKQVRAPPPRATPDDDEEIGMGLRPKQARLVSDNWEGDQYRGSNWNILTVILGLTFLVPVLGLLFAYLSYGTLWSSTGTYGRLYF